MFTEIMIPLWWWHTPLTIAYGRQRQEDLREFKASLVYRVSYRIARAVQRNPEKQQKKRRNYDSIKNIETMTSFSVSKQYNWA